MIQAAEEGAGWPGLWGTEERKQPQVGSRSHRGKATCTSGHVQQGDRPR